MPNLFATFGPATVDFLPAETTAVGNSLLQRGPNGEAAVSALTVTSITNSGGTTGPTRAVATTDTATIADDLILANAAGGAFTETLPVASSCPGQEITVKRVNATNNVTVGSAGGTIDGASTCVLTAQWMAATFKSDGTNWYIKSKA
jgi:hypothetical protein